MEYVIGLVLGIAIAAAATLVGFGRERSFYPTVLIVIGSYYVLFAAMAPSRGVLAVEVVCASVFMAAGFLGFTGSLWIVAVALAGHGIFDFLHHLLIHNPGVPPWWPGFCLTFDLVFSLFLVVTLLKHPRFSSTSRG